MIDFIGIYRLDESRNSIFCLLRHLKLSLWLYFRSYGGLRYVIMQRMCLSYHIYFGAKYPEASLNSAHYLEYTWRDPYFTLL